MLKNYVQRLEPPDVIMACQWGILSLMALDAEQLKRLIRQAFESVKLGEGIGLWEAQAIDDYEPPKIRKERRARDQTESWQNIPDEDLRQCESSLSFFDAAGMRFHIPAFMIAEINGNSSVGPIYSLTDLFDYTLEQFAALSDPQRNAVSEFLLYLDSLEPEGFDRERIQKALADYWVLPRPSEAKD